MTTSDLLALLSDARNELAVLASYVDDPKTVWPNAGLKMTAKAHKKLVARIDEWMAEPVEELPLRQENLALRAALAVRWNDENWRLRYLEQKSEVERLIPRLAVLESALASISLDEYESTSSASEKVHGHARIARKALYGDKP